MHVVSSASCADEKNLFATKTDDDNANSCTRLLTPLFSLYRFVVSRNSGAAYIYLFLLERPGSPKPGLPKL